MRLAKRLVSGVDIWLNTPTRAQELPNFRRKAEMNGVLNLSVLDGGGMKDIEKAQDGP